jgi:glycosyltransferase involved in cell wall biosynthesis
LISHTSLSQQPILALIPAHNEASHIAGVVKSMAGRLPVLVVDDGSTDNTSEAAALAGSVVISQTPNQGKGSALRNGFQWALAEGYEAVITLDGDGQHDPADIPAFLRAYSEYKSDLIIGRRNFSEMPPVRRLSNTLGRMLFSWAVGRNVPDNQSGYRLLSRRLMEALLDSTETGFEFEVEMITAAILHGFSLDWVDIRTIYAGENSHIQPLRHVSRFIQTSLRAHRQIRAKRNVARARARE